MIVSYYLAPRKTTRIKTYMKKLGVVHGRFQVLHNDHMKYILAAKRCCDQIVIGITNPDPSLTGSDETNPERSLTSSNPLTYFERYTLVKSAMAEAGLGYLEFGITPFPINFPNLYRFYVPTEAVFYITIYDDWGRRKLKLLTDAGLKTELLWDKTPDQKGLSGSYVRGLIQSGGQWERLVPESVALLIREWDIQSRLKELS